MRIFKMQNKTIQSSKFLNKYCVVNNPYTHWSIRQRYHNNWIISIKYKYLYILNIIQSTYTCTRCKLGIQANMLTT